MRGKGSSVSDLVIEIKNEKGSIMEKIVVKPRIESDHLIVEVYLEKRGVEEAGVYGRKGKSIGLNRKKTEIEYKERMER